ncbi:hypothetical protein BH23ACT9_BH23ACT9_25390 [soil metagenome]
MVGSSRWPWRTCRSGAACRAAATVTPRWSPGWPAGTEIDRADPLTIRLPGGSTVKVGEVVSGGGGYHSDVAMFPEGCAESGETAIFNASGDIEVVADDGRGSIDRRRSCPPLRHGDLLVVDGLADRVGLDGVEHDAAVFDRGWADGSGDVDRRRSGHERLHQEQPVGCELARGITDASDLCSLFGQGEEGPERGEHQVPSTSTSAMSPLWQLTRSPFRFGAQHLEHGRVQLDAVHLQIQGGEGGRETAGAVSGGSDASRAMSS